MERKLGEEKRDERNTEAHIQLPSPVFQQCFADRNEGMDRYRLI